MATNSSFNLSKSTKRIMASIGDKEQRNIYKQAMINAEHSYIVNKHRRPRERDNTATRDVPGDN